MRKQLSTYFKTSFLVISVLFAGALQPAWGGESDFPIDSRMRKRVDFWKKVYTEINSNQGFVHDILEPWVIYETVDFGKAGRRARRRIFRKKKKEIRATLDSIIRKKKENLNDREKKVLVQIGDRSVKELKKMKRRVRIQLGLANNYLIGLKRSYLYLDRIREILKKEKIPLELAFLPHVESSFNYKAYSKVGAAGIWQFMRATARLYRMKVNYVVDERRDPIRATRAAAKFLRDNYNRLKAWPLAITAYNHGPVSLVRAVKKLGTRNISDIIDRYEGRRFGFASKNFYATFMATVEISRAPEYYFGEFERADRIEFSTIKLHDRLRVRQISRTLGFSYDQLREFNPSIRAVVYRSNLSLPKGFKLKIPKLKWERLAQYKKVFAELRPAKRVISSASEHIVSRGESLYVIARVYEVRMSDLIVLNQISNPSRVFPGMKIKIPGKGKRKKKAASMVAAVPKVEAPTDPVKMVTIPGKTIAQAAPAVVPAPVQEKKSFFSKIKGFFESEKTRTVGLVERVDEGAASTIETAPVEPRKAVTRNFVFDSQTYDFDAAPQADGSYIIQVEVEETIGHLAEWAGIRASEIRKANFLSFGESISIGQSLKIPVSEEALLGFNLNRIEYHQAIEEDLFTNYMVGGTKDYTVKRGDTLGEITRRNETPFWLLRKYQDSTEFKNLKVGQIIKIPQLNSISR